METLPEPHRRVTLWQLPASTAGRSPRRLPSPSPGCCLDFLRRGLEREERFWRKHTRVALALPAAGGRPPCPASPAPAQGVPFSPEPRGGQKPGAPRREERGDRRRCRAAGDGAAGRGRRLVPAPTAANGRQRSLTAAERPPAVPIGAAHTFGHEASEGKL